jgi:hypothetical protein
MRSIREILDRKLQGTDCTEEESAEIKGYIKENPECTELFLGIIENFPIEHEEAVREMEDEKSELVDEVIERIKKDIEAGDVSAIYQLLSVVSSKQLLNFLPEEQWDKYPFIKRKMN